MRMNKKSDIAVEKALIYGFVVAILLSVLFIVLVFILGVDVVGYTKITPGLEEFIFIQRFLNSPQCFVYQEKDTGIFKPRVVDWSKFNEYSPNKCYSTSNENVAAFGFILHNLDTGEVKPDTPDTNPFQTKNWRGDPIKKKKKLMYRYSKMINSIMEN